MTTFELQGSEMTSRGDFWALMFFVVALVNGIGYAVFGWYCNVVAQVFLIHAPLVRNCVNNRRA